IYVQEADPLRLLAHLQERLLQVLACGTPRRAKQNDADIARTNRFVEGLCALNLQYASRHREVVVAGREVTRCNRAFASRLRHFCVFSVSLCSHASTMSVAEQMRGLLKSVQHNLETAQTKLDALKELLTPPPPPSANVFPAEYAQTMPNDIHAFIQAEIAKKDASSTKKDPPPVKKPQHPLHA